MTSDTPEGNALRQLFGGLIEQVFMVELGMCAPSLTAYLSRLLTDFVHIDQIYRLRTLDHDIIRDISQMEAQANLGPDIDETTRRRIINRYIGDFTLFWAGVYPEALRPRGRAEIHQLGLYVHQGKRSYGIASELTPPDEEPPPDVLHRLSEDFEYCLHGLQLVRAGWEQLSHRSGN